MSFVEYFVPSDLGSWSQGMLTSLLGWAIFLILILPWYLRRQKAQTVQEIKVALPEIIKEAAPALKEALALDMKAIFESIRTDIESKEDNATKRLLADASIFLTGIATTMIIESWDDKDNKIKAFIRGEINNQAEIFKKSFLTRMETAAAKYGIDIEEGTDGIGEQEPTGEMAKFMRIVKRGMMLKKELEGGI